DRTRAFVAAHDDLQQVFGGGQRELAHSEIVNDEQRKRDDPLDVLFPGAVQSCIGKFIKQSVSLSIQHPVALRDDRLTDCLRDMALARAWRTQQQSILAPGNERTGSQIEHKAAIHFLVEAEVKVVESLMRIAEAGLFSSALKQPIASPAEFVRD